MIMWFLVYFVVIMAGWINHLYVCFTEEAWGFLIAGAIFFPIGFFHGIGNLVGIW